jgi:hypothetical protein
MKDYSDVQWVFVNRIERTDELTIEVQRDRHTTIYEYDTPEECLENLMKIKKLWREKSGKKWEFKRKSSKRFSDVR